MSERLFFALWPDDAVRGLIAERVPPGCHGGRPQRQDQWHVTVVFLGDVEPPRSATVRACAELVRVPPFTLTFDAIEYWRRARVLCLTAAVTPTPLADLANTLRAGLHENGFAVESRPLTPHVTLARKVTAAPERDVLQPIAWPVDRFALVRSVTDAAGSRYEPLRWWNLQAETC